MEVTKHGEPVFAPSARRLSRAVRHGVVRRRIANDSRGPIGRWVKLGDPDYEAVFREQRRLESEWIDAREQTGDG